MSDPTPHPPTGDDTDSPAAREALTQLRHALLRVHKTLLEMERRDYEKEHGAVNAGELFRLVIEHPQFDWLHNISEFVVRIDEALAAKNAAVTDAFAQDSLTLAHKMFTPAENGDGFQRKYYEAIQREPAVVMDHAELARLFASDNSEKQG